MDAIRNSQGQAVDESAFEISDVANTAAAASAMSNTGTVQFKFDYDTMPEAEMAQHSLLDYYKEVLGMDANICMKCPGDLESYLFPEVDFGKWRKDEHCMDFREWPIDQSTQMKVYEPVDDERFAGYKTAFKPHHASCYFINGKSLDQFYRAKQAASDADLKLVAQDAIMCKIARDAERESKKALIRNGWATPEITTSLDICKLSQNVWIPQVMPCTRCCCGMYACMCACRVCIYACMHLRMHACMHVCMHVYMYACMHIAMRVFMRV